MVVLRHVFIAAFTIAGLLCSCSSSRAASNEDITEIVAIAEVLSFETPLWTEFRGEDRLYSTMRARLFEVYQGPPAGATILVISLAGIYIHPLTNGASWNAGGGLDDPWRVYAAPGDYVVVRLRPHPFVGTPKAKELPKPWATAWFASEIYCLSADPSDRDQELLVFNGLRLEDSATDTLRKTGKAPPDQYQIRWRSCGIRLGSDLRWLLDRERPIPNGF